MLVHYVLYKITSTWYNIRIRQYHIFCCFIILGILVICTQYRDTGVTNNISSPILVGRLSTGQSEILSNEKVTQRIS